jgi:hypothetical protein
VEKNLVVKLEMQIARKGIGGEEDSSEAGKKLA